MSKCFMVRRTVPRPKGYETPLLYVGQTVPENWDMAVKLSRPIEVTLNAGEYAFVLTRTPLSFYDKDTGFYGGWDGARGDPYNDPGSKNVAHNKKPALLYRTDHSGLESITVEVS